MFSKGMFGHDMHTSMASGQVALRVAEDRKRKIDKAQAEFSAEKTVNWLSKRREIPWPVMARQEFFPNK